MIFGALIIRGKNRLCIRRNKLTKGQYIEVVGGGGGGNMTEHLDKI